MMITLRQVIHRGLQEALKDEDLVLESELKQLTAYILDNSYVEITEENIYLGSGNLLGIGEENKDKELVLPRFMIFRFKDRDIRSEKSRWNWSLQSCEDFEDLEEMLSQYDFSNAKYIAIIDNEVVRHECEGLEESFGLRRATLNWEQEVYSISYKKENTIIEKRFKSRQDLEKYILELVAKNAEDVKGNIKVKNLVENKKMGFSVGISETVYVSTIIDKKNKVSSWLEWREVVEEDTWDWDDDFEDFDFS